MNPEFLSGPCLKCEMCDHEFFTLRAMRMHISFRHRLVTNPTICNDIAIAVIRAYPSSSLEHQMVLAMRQSKGTAHPSVMRAALEHHRTTSAKAGE